MTQARVVRIWHLEDDPKDAELVAERLNRERIQFEIQRITNQPDFEKALAEREFDVILSDFTMPGFSGEAALRSAQELRPQVPFIFVSGTIGGDQAVECLKAGATDYVLKGHLDRLPA